MIPWSTCHSRCAATPRRDSRGSIAPRFPITPTHDDDEETTPLGGEEALEDEVTLRFSSPERVVTENKATVARYMEGFRNSDHEQILSCLTDDVVWDIPGAFHIEGKAAFDREIENDAFVGKPAITVTRVLEENDVVVAEGTVRVQRKGGDFMNLVFCDVFVMRGGKIQQLISYLVPLNAGAPSAG